jgi:hypothetical protein
MKTKFYSIAVIVLLNLAASYNPTARACGLPELSLDTLVKQAVSEDQTVSAAAVARLRARGPAGLDALLKANAALIVRHESQAGVTSGSEGPEWNRLKTALDTVGSQCDCYASRLYWYTDLDAAKAVARTSRKPILSLRLLGKLNEEYSCANSRFFRTTLYPNAQVSKYLRDHFILHWQSVRPVPKITIDFGDGRRIERTITGNSIHYILDSDGELVDALPGLYGPNAFLEQLKNSERAALACSGVSAAQKQECLVAYHSGRRDATTRAWNEDLAELGERARQLPLAALMTAGGAPPTAGAAGRLAFSKRAIEAPLLKSTQPPETGQPGRASVSDELWARIAALHASETRLDEPSFRLIATKLPTAFEASQLATSKSLVENPALRTLRNLRRSMAEDTVRNEYVLHAQIHQWFVQNQAPRNLEVFNAKVYAELFLMPASDPWLGLAPADVFSALPNDGLEQPVTAPAGPSTGLTKN